MEKKKSKASVTIYTYLYSTQLLLSKDTSFLPALLELPRHSYCESEKPPPAKRVWFGG